METNFSRKSFLSYEDDPIDIRYDNVFKAVFTNESLISKTALSKLISAFIDKEVSVLAVVANEPPIRSLGERKIRFDISCRTEQGERINVEMSFLSEISDKRDYPRSFIIRIVFVS